METNIQPVEDQALKAEAEAIFVAANAQNQTPKSNKIKIIVISIILLLIISGGSVFGYNVFLVKPENVISKMMSRVVDLKSLNFEASMKSDTTSTIVSGKRSITEVKMTGASDLSDPNNIKSELDIISSTKTNDKDSFKFSLAAITIGQVFYFKLNELTDQSSSYTSFIDSFKKDLENQWLKLDFEQLSKDMQVAMPQSQRIEQPKLTEEQSNKIREAISRSTLITVKEDLGVTVINKMPVYHYKFEFNKKGISNLIKEVVLVILTEEQRKAMGESGQSIASEIESANMPSGEIWIGMFDKTIKKIVLISGSVTTLEKGTVTFEILFKDYNKAVQIDAPENTKSLNNLINMIFGSFLNAADIKSSNQKTETTTKTMNGTTKSNDGGLPSFELPYVAPLPKVELP